MFKIQKLFMLCTLFFTLTGCGTAQKPKLKALIIDGQNNHGVWPKTTVMIKSYLEETGLFDVDIQRTTYMWQGPHFNKMEGVENIEELLDMYPIDDVKRTSVEEPKPDPQFNP